MSATPPQSRGVVIAYWVTTVIVALVMGLDRATTQPVDVLLTIYEKEGRGFITL